MKGDEAIPLNVQEFRLLEVFVRNPNRVLSEAWGYDTETTTRTRGDCRPGAPPL